ncbi:glycosyltransferase family 4 protein [Pelagibacteraceae bacterium]|nr:glycosyltransferase family 4 protein [Pelagibacteraceae bacterium]
MKIVYFINNLGFFVSHRLPLALEAKKRGWEVYLITGKPGSKKIDRHGKEIFQKTNIKHYQFNIDSAFSSFFVEMYSLFKIIILLKKIKPNIVHTATPKGNFYTMLISFFIRKPKYIFSFSGLGTMFNERKFFILKIIYNFLIKFIKFTKNKNIILQNKDDYKWFKKLNVAKNIFLVPGSGVDLNKTKKIKYNLEAKNVIFVGRYLYNKGLMEFLKASKILKKQFKNWNFIIIGANDYNNPVAVPQKIIRKFIDNGSVIDAGYTKNIYKYYKNTAIICLPSYREGLPLCLLEAACCGIPIVTANAIGCRESLINNKTGYLVKVGSISDIVIKIRKLILNQFIRKQFSRNAKLYGMKRFNLKNIITKIFSIYEY